MPHAKTPRNTQSPKSFQNLIRRNSLLAQPGNGFGAPRGCEIQARLYEDVSKLSPRMLEFPTLGVFYQGTIAKTPENSSKADVNQSDASASPLNGGQSAFFFELGRCPKK